MSKKLILMVITIFCLFMVGISYAVVTMTLNINGTAHVKGASWDVHYEGLVSTIKEGDVVELNEPEFPDGSTSIVNVNVLFKEPNSKISYIFKVYNGGTFDAELNDLTIATPVCTGSGSNKANDENLVCNNITTTLTDLEGNSLDDDVLLSDSEKEIMFTISYNANTMPYEEVKVTGIKATAAYSQK